MPLDPSAYADSFARDRLPPEALWPRLDADGVIARHGRRLNAAASLFDRARAAGWMDRPLIRTRDASWSYGDVDMLSDRIAGVLRHRLGVQSGNRVLLRAPNSPMLAAAWFGVIKAGAIAVTTMPLLRARDLRPILERADIHHALCDARLTEDLAAAAEGRDLAVIAFNSDAPDGLERLAAAAPAGLAPVIASHDDVALIAFTSGTTGQPKGTLHFHRDILAICETVADHVLAASADDIITGSAPLGFTYGLGSLLLFPMWRGASTVFLERPTPDALLGVIRDLAVTILLTGPTLYRTLLAAAQPGDLAGLRACISSGEHLPVAVFNAWQAATGIAIRNILGSTEMLHAFAAAPVRAAAAGSLGKVLPGYEARVVDDALRPVAPGVVGRLAVRGPTGCRYLDDPEQQRRSVADGWTLTGDAFHQDADGTLWYHARTDDIIVSSGYNISAIEIETVLLEHAAVAACAVVAVEDAARGAIAKAFIVLRPPHAASEDLARALQDHVKATLAPYKYPRAVAFVEALPMTATGKIQRSALKQMTERG